MSKKHQEIFSNQSTEHENSILSIIYIANIVTITLTDPMPTVPSIAVASPKPALLKIVGA